MRHRFVSLALVMAMGDACQGPPPVGRAADPTPPAMGNAAGSESADLLRKVDGLKKELKDRPKSHDVKMALSKLYYENERFLDAAVLLREILDDKPGEAEARKLLGNCMFFLGNPDMAIALHDQVLAENPQDIDAMFFLGAILVESRPQDVDALKRTESLWTRFVETAPQHPRQSELQQQLEVVRKAIRGEIQLGHAPPAPQRPAAEEMPETREQGAMGGRVSFEKEGPQPAAGPRFKKGTRVASLGANATPLEQKKAEALDALDEGRFQDARKAAEAGLQLAPEESELGTSLARALVQLGELEAAIRRFGEVIKRNPRFAPAWHYLGMAHMMNQDPKRAAQTWRDLIQMDGAYAAEHRLEMRAQMAERMARNAP
jgi:tetratricopeptide (TPR) repeat protein